MRALVLIALLAGCAANAQAMIRLRQKVVRLPSPEPEHEFDVLNAFDRTGLRRPTSIIVLPAFVLERETLWNVWRSPRANDPCIEENEEGRADWSDDLRRNLILKRERDAMWINLLGISAVEEAARKGLRACFIDEPVHATDRAVRLGSRLVRETERQLLQPCGGTRQPKLKPSIEAGTVSEPAIQWPFMMDYSQTASDLKICGREFREPNAVQVGLRWRSIKWASMLEWQPAPSIQAEYAAHTITPQARKLYQLAADAGSVRAHLALGLIHKLGLDVQPDRAKSERHYAAALSSRDLLDPEGVLVERSKLRYLRYHGGQPMTSGFQALMRLPSSRDPTQRLGLEDALRALSDVCAGVDPTRSVPLLSAPKPSQAPEPMLIIHGFGGTRF